MAHMHEQRRQRALDSYLAGAPIEDICREVAGSKSWRYQWRDRSLATDPAWSAALSRRPRTTPPQTPQRITQIVVALRQTLAQHGKDCGAAAIQQALAQQGREPVRNTAKVTLSAQVIGIRQLGDLLPSAYFACPYIASGRVSS